jgi:hypothetical protein
MDEDMILPDDFVETPPQADEQPVDMQEADFEDTEQAAEDTKPADEPTEPQEPGTQPLKIPVKFNHQDMELTVEEAAALAQKGMNYEKAIERARQEAAQQAKDALIADMGYTWNGKPITTEAEYKQALQEQELINKYKDRDLPEEVIRELVENRRFREEQQRERAEKEEQAKQQAQYNEFFAFFEEVNERPFDAKKDTIPAEVQEAVQNGQSLMTAYMRHHAKEMRNQLKIAKQNQANTRKAPIGSVTAGGGTRTEAVDPFMEGFNSI